MKYGVVQGGVVPVSGATIQLYAIGSSDGGPSTPLIPSPLLSDSSGEFDLAGVYTCPSADALVYVVATGGDPGTGQTNPRLNLMTVLGKCGDITATTNITINEVTTVAAVWSLAPFMQAADAVGASANNDAALAAAFRSATLLVNPATGTIPGANAPNDATLPIEEINTLADILASCIQSVGGAAGDGSVCGKLFDYTTAAGEAAPNNVIAAALSLANNPGQHAADLFALLPSPLPFQPVLTSAPASFTLPTTFPSGLLVAPATVSFDTVFMGDTSSKAITLTNQGSASIQLTSILVSGSSAQEFSYALTSPQTPCSLSASLAGGATCTIVVGLSPTSAGQKSADLQITSTAPNGLIHVPLSGQAQEVTSGSVSFTATPGSLNFSQIGIPQTITVTNTGTLPINLVITPNYLPSRITGQPTDGSGWGESDNCTQAEIAPSASCTVSVQAYVIGTNSNDQIPLFLTVEAHAGTNIVTQDVLITPQWPSGVILSGKPLDFGTWSVGTESLSQTIALTYPQNIYLLNQGLTGPNAADFVADCDTTIGQCAVSFRPSGLGLRTATLQTQYGNIALSGAGQPAGPSITITPSLTGPQVVGSNGQDSFRIVNNGTTTLTMESTLIPPTDPSVFSIVPGDSCGSPLAPKATCAIFIQFKPTQVGDQTASLQVKDVSSGFTVVKTFTQTAISANAGLSLSPNPLDFGAVQLNTPAQYQSILSRDTFSASAPTGGNASGDFSVSFVNCGVPNGLCTLQVRFVPSALGLRTTSFVVTDETTGKSSTLQVQGTGAQPILQVSPNSLSFPSTEAGTSSAAQIITIKNNGTLASNLQAAIAGTNAVAFALGFNGCNISPGQSCNLQVFFRPVAQGQASATLQLAGSNISIPLTGVGVAATVPAGLGLSSTSLSFSEETVGYSTGPQGLTITNTGQSAQDVTVQVLDGNGQLLYYVEDYLVENADRCLALQAEEAAGSTLNSSRRWQEQATLS